MYTDDNITPFVFQLRKDSSYVVKFYLFSFSVTILNYILAHALKFFKAAIHIPILEFLGLGRQLKTSFMAEDHKSVHGMAYIFMMLYICCLIIIIYI